MTSFSSTVVRRTLEPYRHYRKRIVVKLGADMIQLRLERTRKVYAVPVSTLLDVLTRWEAQRIVREKQAARKAKRRR